MAGFFIIEGHVLATTGSFRSEQEVEELWEGLIARLSTGVQYSLAMEKEPEAYLSAKEALIGFIMAMEVNLLPALLCLRS